ncbi:MAG: transcription elongation factor GreA [Deltaproteobacteria bacterium]|nr:transcription elongation factor GreA [Deltaproteobacteria bacterium]
MADSERVPITPAGLARLEEELRRFKDERPVIIKAIGEARALGDLSENAEYHAARERQGLIEAQIRQLESLITRADVIDPAKMSGPVIRFGATITLMDEDKGEEVHYQLVGDAEADISHGRLSVRAPLGRALLGREPGDEIEFKAPAGVRHFTVVEVEYK